MKFFWKYIFPGLYGLLNYFTIRLLLDSVTGMRFWHRSWKLNLLEMGTSIVIGYVLLGCYRGLFRYFDRGRGGRVRDRGQVFRDRRQVWRELLAVALVNQVLVNLLLTPLAAFTDDGLQWFDLVDINTIPLLLSLIYYGVTRSHMFLKDYMEGQLNMEKMRNDQLQTELRFLKAQFHPHFLFNALNTIYFQMDDDVASAKKSVEKFSELLRYQLYDQEQMVPVSREVHYLENYIALQRVRISERLTLDVDFDGQLGEQPVYPLLFLPLVENAFKYVGGDFEILIQGRVTQKGVSFLVRNSLPDLLSPDLVLPVREGGIGLENLRRRLALLYTNGYELKIEHEGRYFLAELCLPIKIESAAQTKPAIKTESL